MGRRWNRWKRYKVACRDVETSRFLEWVVMEERDGYPRGDRFPWRKPVMAISPLSEWRRT